MGDKRPYKPRKPGAGRKPLKPDYDAAAILQEQIQAAVYKGKDALSDVWKCIPAGPFLLCTDFLSYILLCAEFWYMVRIQKYT